MCRKNKELRFSTPYAHLGRTPAMVENEYRALSFRQQLKLWLFGSISTDQEIYPHLIRHLTFCSKHGISETHPQGYRNRLGCHLCIH